ncbi:MAG: NADP-dependent oxidoreductase [Steroidobacteraceae bacterium]
MKSNSSLVRAAVGAAILAVTAGVAFAATPKEQKAIVITANGGPEVLKLQSIPVLEPGKDQVLIKVYAAAVNPVDWKMRQGMGGMGAGAAPGGEGMGGGAPAGAPAGGAPGAGGPPGGGEGMGGAPAGGGAAAFSPSVPGMDVAGVVEKVGPGVTTLKVGDAVFSMIGRGGVTGLNGGYSQYVVAPAANVISKPKNLSYAEAAGLGTAGMTGDRAINTADIQKGQRVFINGIAGGVGSAAAQVAKAKGAYVIGTASAKHNAYLKSIGVDEVIDYTKVQFEDAIKQPVDVAIETVGAETATRALKIIKKGGKLISVAGSPGADACAAAGVVCPAGGPPGANGPTEGQLLAEVGKLASEGKYKVNVDASFPLDKAADAQEENRNGGTSGKIIINVDAAQAGKK